MTLFIFAAIIMVALTIAFLFPTLWRKPVDVDADRRAQNIQITREQLATLEEAFKAGEMEEAQYQQSREELEASLLEDTQDQAGQQDAMAMQIHSRWTAVLIAVLLPIFVAGVYMGLGNPDALNPQVMQAQQTQGSPHAQGGMGSVDEMLRRLEEKLTQEPSAEGWLLAGRSYMSLQRYQDAARALKNAYALDSNNPTVMLRYADALAMSRGGRLAGEPFELVKKALALNPQDTTGLWLAGMANEEAGNYAKAVSYWRSAKQQLQSNPQAMQELDGLIARAERKLTGGEAQAATQQPAPEQTTTASAGPTKLKVRVSLDAAMQAKVGPDDTVFIFAKATSGPPMPLAVVRKRVRDLPVEVTLDDSMAMMPQMKLSAFKNVHVQARISKVGSAMPQSGDLQSDVVEAVPGQAGMIAVMVDRAIP